MKSLEGMSILVTGGGSGIGLGTARYCIERGARVTICGRREDKIQAVLSNFKGLKQIVIIKEGRKRESICEVVGVKGERLTDTKDIADAFADFPLEGQHGLIKFG